jgi:hypothetical protein
VRDAWLGQAMPGTHGRTPFVGRERELALLNARLAQARQGEGGAVFVAGDPGIGKSRLLAELAAEARVDGWLVLTGSAYEIDGAAPYLPFSDALRQYLQDLGPRSAGGCAGRWYRRGAARAGARRRGAGRPGAAAAAT